MWYKSFLVFEIRPGVRTYFPEFLIYQTKSVVGALNGERKETLG